MRRVKYICQIIFNTFLSPARHSYGPNDKRQKGILHSPAFIFVKKGMGNGTDGEEGRRRRRTGYALWGASLVYFFYSFFQRAAPSVFIGDLMESFSTDALGAATISSSYFLSYAVLQVPLGILLDRYGPISVSAFGSLLTIFAVCIFSVAETFAMAVFGRLLVGAGVAIPWLAGLYISNTYFPKRRALMTGFTFQCGMLGGIVGQGPLALLKLGVGGWRNAMLCSVVVLIPVTAVFFIVLYGGRAAARTARAAAEETRTLGQRGTVSNEVELGTLKGEGKGKGVVVVEKPPDEARQNTLSLGSQLNLLFVRKRKSTIVLTLYGFFATAPLLALAGLWLVPMVRDVAGVSNAEAGGIASFVYFGALLTGPLGGYLSDRFPKRRKRIMVASCSLSFLFMMSGTFLVGIAPLWAVSGLLFFGGFFLLPGFFLCFFLASDMYEKDMSGLVTSIVNFGALFGGVVFQNIVGAILDYNWDNTIDSGGSRVYSPAAHRLGMVTFVFTYVFQIICGINLETKEEKEGALELVEDGTAV